MFKKINVLALAGVLVCSVIQAQNIISPYSRYALGDVLSTQNILTRGMGGVGTAYHDYQTVNFLNPASYSRLQAVTFDFGVEVDNLALKTQDPPQKFSNASPIMSYINIGIPLKIKKKQVWGLAFGLRPMSRISYRILRNERITSGTINDSVATIFEGTGGSQQVFLGTGFRIRNLSFGINAGYLFGAKDYSTKRIFLNDTVQYYKSNHQATSNFGGVFFNAGVQYMAKLGEKMALRLGAQGSWEQKVKATRSLIRQSFEYDVNDNALQLDRVYTEDNLKGEIILPASYSGGIILERTGHWLLGVDYVASQWSHYRYFNEPDSVQDSKEIRFGGQILPTSVNSYWGNVAYRAGFSFGKDFVRVGSDLPKWAMSGGLGLPMRRVAYTNQFTIINVSFEYGQRGNQNNTLRENFFRIALGLSMSDIWFIKRKYD